MRSLPRPTRRLAIAAAALLAMTACTRGHGRAAAQHAGIDWSSVSSRDLNIASLFLVARDQGVRQALDSLDVLASHDSVLNLQGHGIAHGIGRFAVAQRNFDLAVFAQCRPTFFSGCYHGVLEGYLAGHPGVDASALRGVCVSPAVMASAPYVFRECAHGMGHGLAGVRGHDLFAALGDCDAVLPDGIARGECYDGVFMENVVHSMGGPDMNVGDAMAAARHAETAHDHKLLKDDDPYFPCDSVSAPARQPSCWAYQPVVFYKAFHGAMDLVIAGCGNAPAAAVTECYRGLGKQTLGRMPNRPDEVIGICRRTGAEHLRDCLAGAVESYVDRDWKPDTAFAFCGRTAVGEKPGCYGAVGERVAWIDPAPAAVRAACAPAGAWADACVRAAEAEHASEAVAQAAKWTAPAGAHPLPASTGHEHDHMSMPMPNPG